MNLDGFLNGVLSLTHLLHIPTMDEVRQEFAFISWEAEQEILKSAQAKFNADLQAQEASSMQFKIGAHLDHVENFDEQAESVDVIGAIHFRWTSSHYIWNETNFGGVSQISRFVEEFLPYKPWTPRPTFSHSVWLGRNKFEVPGEFDKFLYEESSQLSINSDGSMVLSVPFSLRLPCNFDFTSFPNDVHVCRIMVETPHALALTFEVDHQIDFWTTNENQNQRTGDFAYGVADSSLDKWTYCRPGACGTHQYAVHAYIFGIEFKRQPDRCYWLFHYPLVIHVLLAQFAATISAEYLSQAYVLLFFNVFCFMKQLSLLRKQLPLSSDGTPFIVIMHVFAIFQIFGVIFTRMTMHWASNRFKEVPTLIYWSLHIAIALLTSIIVIGTLFIRSR